MVWRRLAFLAVVLTQAILLVGSVDRFEGETGHILLEGERIPVHYLPPREYEAAWNQYPELTHNVWYGSFTRGFTAEGHIFLREGPTLNERALLAHELGHILGYPHTLLPTTMNPWGVFRLTDAEGLTRLVDEAYVPPDGSPPSDAVPDVETPGDVETPKAEGVLEPVERFISRSWLQRATG